MSKKYKSVFIFIIACIVLVVIDQVTKKIINSTFTDDIIIIKDFFYISRVYNYGAAFGMLKNSRILFCVITFIILLLIEFVYVRMPIDKRYRILRIDLIVLFSGAAGNLIDRLKTGYVTDFIAFDFGSYSFPRFNVADIYVTLSTILLFILLLFVYKDEDFNNILRIKKHDK